MAKPKTTKDFAYEEMMASAKKLLLEKRVVTLEELEEHLFDGFHKDWSEGAYDNLEGKTRTRWENFTDHIKAQLTNQGFTDKVEVMDTIYLCHTPSRGYLEREGTLMMLGEHLRTIHRLAQRINAEVMAA